MTTSEKQVSQTDLDQEEISVQNFLKEKLKNFIAFLKQVLKSNNTLTRDLHKLELLPMFHFVSYINSSLRPHKDDLDKYLVEMCLQYNLNIYDFKEEDKAKFKKYCECFIEIIESS